MARLFIIGNGYDIARRGDTAYCFFKKWLEKTYIKKGIDAGALKNHKDVNYSHFNNVSSTSMNIYINDEMGELVRATMLEEEDRRKILASVILYTAMEKLGDPLWSTFEEDLSNIPFREYIERYKNENIKMKLSVKNMPGSTVCHEVEQITSFAPEIHALFVEWIESLEDKALVKNIFETNIIKAIEATDTFIIFNYTKTIEKMFSTSYPDVFFYIHGNAADEKTIVVGHNCKEKRIRTNLETEEDYIQEGYSDLYKNPEAVIRSNQALWDRIARNLELEIYEYGWSCSDVDKDYIEKILSITKGKKVSLHLNNYNDSGKGKKKQWEKYGLLSSAIDFYSE